MPFSSALLNCSHNVSHTSVKFGLFDVSGSTLEPYFFGELTGMRRKKEGNEWDMEREGSKIRMEKWWLGRDGMRRKHRIG